MYIFNQQMHQAAPIISILEKAPVRYSSMFINIILNIIALIVIYRLYTKVKKILVMLPIIQQGVVQADPYQVQASFITPAKMTTDSPETVSPFDSYYVIIVILTAILAVIAVIRFLHYLSEIGYKLPMFHHRWRVICGPSQRRHNTRIYLKLMSRTERIVLFLYSLPYEPNVISFTTAPTVRQMRLNSTASELTLTWNEELMLLINTVPTRITMPRTLKIPLCLRRKIRKMITHDLGGLTTQSILFKCYRMDTYIQIPNPNPILTAPPIHDLLPLAHGSPARRDQLYDQYNHSPRRLSPVTPSALPPRPSQPPVAGSSSALSSLFQYRESPPHLPEYTP
jgi:hypothetical protein